MKTLVFSVIFFNLCLFCFSQESPAYSQASAVYGPEAYAIGFKMKIISKPNLFYYGGYLIMGLAPVSGSLGITGGIGWGIGILELNLTLTGWASERTYSNASTSYFSINPYIGVQIPFNTFIKVGPSFFYPSEWNGDGINLYFLNTLWNIEIGVQFNNSESKTSST